MLIPSRHTFTRTAVLVAAALAVVGPGAGSAGAQGVQIGGGVDSQLGLTLNYTNGALSTFQTASTLRTYASKVQVAATATDPGTRLSVADGDTVSSTLRGHLQSAKGPVSLPLQVAVGKSTRQALDSPIDPLLQVFPDPIALSPVTITVSQDIPAGTAEAGPFHKTILITLSPDSP